MSRETRIASRETRVASRETRITSRETRYATVKLPLNGTVTITKVAKTLEMRRQFCPGSLRCRRCPSLLKLVNVSSWSREARFW